MNLIDKLKPMVAPNILNNNLNTKNQMNMLKVVRRESKMRFVDVQPLTPS